MLAAEMLVLLSLDADGGPARPSATAAVLELGAAAALVGELVVAGRVRVDDRGRVLSTGPPPGHPVLDPALAAVERARGWNGRLRHKLPQIARRAGRRLVIDHLIAQELVGRVKDGPLSATRHPPLEGPHRTVLGRYREIVAGATTLDPIDAVVVGLSGPSRLLEVVAPERWMRAHAKARIAEALRQVPGLADLRAGMEAALSEQ